MTKKRMIIAVLFFAFLVAGLVGGSGDFSDGSVSAQAEETVATVATVATVPPEEEAAPTSTPAAPRIFRGPYVPVPSIYIEAVKRGESVTVSSKYFPAGKEFTVRMGYYGTYGINGEEVTTVTSESGGNPEWTFAIPEKFKDQTRIAIRLESSSGYYSYNWFWNYDAN